MSPSIFTGDALAYRRPACWAVYILTGQRAGAEHGPATVAVGSLIAAIIFVSDWRSSGWRRWRWSILPLGFSGRW